MTSNLRPRLPDFVVIGAAKAGTNWINACLREHPEVFVPSEVSEIFFFDRYFDRGTEWYARYFRGYAGQKRVGEVGGTYFHHPEAPRRLRQVLPEATLIVSFRNPIDVAWSRYRDRWRKGEEPSVTGFRAACARSPKLVWPSEYARLMKAWLSLFPREQIHALVLEDAHADPFQFMRRLYQILGVDPEFLAAATTEDAKKGSSREPRSLLMAKVGFRLVDRLHRSGLHSVVTGLKQVGLKGLLVPRDGRARKQRPAISEEDRRWLGEHYREDVAALSELTGRDLATLWLGRRP